MAHYNLLKDCYVESPTSSGTGDLSLTQTDILKLYDKDLSSSSIDILSSDTLYLDIALHKRIRLDDIYLYMDVIGDRGAALSNINFYYKNDDSGEFQLLGKSVDADKFYMIPNLVVFAPKNLRVTVSGIDASLYELEVLNYDYNIAFGEDGSMTEKQLYLEDSYSTVPVYNNSTDSDPATAYVAVDPSSGDLCEYVKLANSADGDYVSISEASIGVATGQTFTYNFKMGSYSNTFSAIDGSSVGLVGTNNINSEYTHLADIVLDQNDYAGWGVGQNSWDFTNDNVVYTIAAPKDEFSLYLFRLNNTTEDWYNCGLINTTGYVIDDFGSMAIVDNYAYVILNAAGDFGRINLNNLTTPITFESLGTCPHGSLSNKVAQGLCSDHEEYLYSIAISVDHTVAGEFYKYSTVSGTWSPLNNGFGNNNYTVYPTEYPSRAVLVYDSVRSYIYMECGHYANTGDSAGTQAYYVAGDFWVYPWQSHTYQYGHAISYYANYLVMCGFGHGYNVYVKNIRDGEETLLTLNYNQDINLMGSSSAARYASRVLCYPKPDGSVGVMVAGGPEQKVTYFSLGRDINTITQGTYTTPILEMGTPPAAAFFYVDRTVPSGTSISYGGIDNYDSMLVRGFDTAPLPFCKMYTAYKPTETTFAFFEKDIYDKGKISIFDCDSSAAPFDANKDTRVIECILFDSFNYELVFYIYDSYSSDSASFFRWDLRKSEITNTISFSANFNLTSTAARIKHLTMDAVGNTWLYNGSTLYFFDVSLDYTALTITDTAADFIYAISGSKVFDYCWYTNKSTKRLECIDTESNKLFSISMGNPQHLCAMQDGGCAVVDKNNNTIYRYSSAGAVISSCSILPSYDIVDFKEDVSSTEVIFYWTVLSNSTLLRIREDGFIHSESVLQGVESVTPFSDGIIAHAPGIKVTYYVSSDGELLYTWDHSSYGSVNTLSAVFCVPYYDLMSSNEDFFIDATEDPIWAKDVDNWSEIKMDNSFFGGKQYYQMKFLFNTAPGLESPTINKIYFSKAIKLTDIYPGNYKNVYVKTNLPEVCEEKEYAGDLRCWWTRRES